MAPAIQLTLNTTNANLVSVRTGGYSATVAALMRSIPNNRWDPVGKLWNFPLPLLPQAVKLLSGMHHTLGPGLAVVEDALPPHTPDMDIDTAREITNGYTFKTKPFEHQRTAMILAAKARQFAFLMEMGTGKTKATIDTLSWWFQRDEIGGALIVCPKAVLFSWERELAVHSPLQKEDRRVAVLTGTGAQKEAALNESSHLCNFFVTNYATLLADLDLATLIKRRRLALVLDESTNIKTHSARTSKAALALGMLSPYKLILTGTPITQGPLDAFSQFGFLDPDILGHHNYFSFKAEYAITGGFQGKEVVGYRNLERLSKRIEPRSYRVLKKDCLDLPEKLYRTVEVVAGPQQKLAYKMMKEESIVEIEGKVCAAPVVLTKMLRLAQITAGFLPLQDEFGADVGFKEFEHPKMDAMLELVEEAVSGGRKVLVWCRFIHEVKHAMELLEKHGAAAYYGEVSAHERQRTVDRFQNDPGCKVFIGQLQAGGIGITLTAATVEIYLSNSFTLADRLQSEDRAHRIGQRNNVDIIDLVVRGTVDRYILQTLRDKKNLADVITGDNFREVAGDA